MIIPSGIATDDTTKVFFQDLIESGELVSLHSFENEEFLFPAVHHSAKFCLITMTGPRHRRGQPDFVSSHAGPSISKGTASLHADSRRDPADRPEHRDMADLPVKTGC